jgi:hypothetical protein
MAGCRIHGGFLGVIVASWLYSRHQGIRLDRLLDLAATGVPIGLGLGRLANFINGELYGRPTSVPWAMVFPNGGPEPRHPSQLYEALLEGLVLFIVIKIATDRYHALVRRALSPASCSGLRSRPVLRRVLSRARCPDRAGDRLSHRRHAPVRAAHGDRHLVDPSRAQGGMTPLEAIIRELVIADGPMTIDRFMMLCLAHPRHGYYMARMPFGRQGDFVTAPEVSQIFGELIGVWCIAAWGSWAVPIRSALSSLVLAAAR